MGPFFRLIRKLLADSRWLLLFSAAALFGLSYLTCFAVYQMERGIRTGGGGRGFRAHAAEAAAAAEKAAAKANGAGAANGEENGDDESAKPETEEEAQQKAERDRIMAQFRREQMTQGMRTIGGAAVDGTSGSFEVALWCHPLFMIPLLIAWPIARGAASIAGEIDRGTLDLVMSRPITRTGFLMAQLTACVIGLVVLALALISGNLLGNSIHQLESPPSIAGLLRAGCVVVALGLAIYGYTVLLSSLDRIGWRVVAVATGITFLCGVCSGLGQLFSNIPTMTDWKWIGKLSIFRVYDPVDAFVAAKDMAANIGILAGLGAAGVILGLVIFTRRDLPAIG